MKKTTSFICFSLLILTFSFSQTDPKKTIEEVSKKIEEIKTIQYDLFSWERFGKKIKMT